MAGSPTWKIERDELPSDPALEEQISASAFKFASDFFI